MKRGEDNDDDWGFGDAWKTGSVEGEQNSDDVEYVELMRTDTGHGYDDSLMLELVAYLGFCGIRATYDSFSLGMEPAAIKTYVLRVEAGKEVEARDCLKHKETGDR